MRMGNMFGAFAKMAKDFGGKITTGFEEGIDSLSSLISDAVEKINNEDKSSLDRLFDAAKKDGGAAFTAIGDKFHDMAAVVKKIDVSDDKSFFDSLTSFGDKLFSEGPLHNTWDALKSDE